jgi:hypothetical protein
MSRFLMNSRLFLIRVFFSLDIVFTSRTRAGFAPRG